MHLSSSQSQPQGLCKSSSLSLSLYLFQLSTPMLTSEQKLSGCEDSQGSHCEPIAAQRAAQGDAEPDIYTNHREFSFQRRCRWLLRLVTGMDCCFKIFYTELCKVVAYCQWPAGEIAHLPKINYLVWSWFYVHTYTVHFNWQWFVDKNTDSYLNGYQFVLSRNERHQRLKISKK